MFALRKVDFEQGETLLETGRVLTARDIGLAAAMTRVGRA